jgi:hypothetical protein
MNQHATFRMTDQHIGTAKIHQHSRRNTPNIDTILILTDILPTPHNIASLQQELHLEKIGYKHADSKIRILQIAQTNNNTDHQNFILHQTTMHFPITNNQLTTHFFTHEI